MEELSPTAETILNSARQLIVRGGYDGFSYADISAVVGIRKASIHHHFPTKSDLVRTLVERYRKEAAAGFEALSKAIPGPAEQLAAYVGYWEKCIVGGAQPFCICALLATQYPTIPAEVALEVRAHFQGLSQWLEAVLRRGVETGDLHLSGTPHEEAEALMAMVHGAMLSARAYGKPAMFAATVRAYLARLDV